MRCELRTDHDAPGRGFTLIEMLVVIGIIALVAGMSLGVGVSLRRKAAVDRTRVLIRKVETALDAHKDTFGGYPSEITTVPMDQANIAVAEILLEQDVVGESAREISRQGGQPHVVDAWGNDLQIVSGGFNRPDLDIWSWGRNEVSEWNDSDPKDYGDDIVNWVGR